MAESYLTTRDGLHIALANMALQPPGKDLYVGAFAHAYAELESHPILDAALDALWERPDVDGAHGANLLLRAIQMQLLERYPQYPRHPRDSTLEPYLCTPAGWLDVSQEIDPDDVYTVMRLRSVVSNVGWRAIALALPMGVYSERFKHATVFEGGSSQGQIAAQLRLKDDAQYGLQGIQVHAALPGAPYLGLHDEATRQVAQLITDAPVPQQYIGCDIWSRNDADNIRWAEACSLRPAERLDPSRLERFQLLQAVAAHADTIHHHTADLNTVRPQDLKQYGQDGADIALLSAVLYQIPDKQRAVDTMCDLVQPTNGMVLVFEAANQHPSIWTREPHYQGDYNAPWGVKLYAVSPQDPSQYHHLATFRDGRAKDMILGGGWRTLEQCLV